MTANPKLQVLVASGYYDLACSYFANDYLASHLEPRIARNVVARSYRGGHAIYTDKDCAIGVEARCGQVHSEHTGAVALAKCCSKENTDHVHRPPLSPDRSW